MNSEESDLIIGHLQKHDGGSNAKRVNHLVELLARGRLGCVTHTFHLDLRPECQTGKCRFMGQHESALPKLSGERLRDRGIRSSGFAASLSATTRSTPEIRAMCR